MLRICRKNTANFHQYIFEVAGRTENLVFSTMLPKKSKSHLILLILRTELSNFQRVDELTTIANSNYNLSCTGTGNKFKHHDDLDAVSSKNVNLTKYTNLTKYKAFQERNYHKELDRLQSIKTIQNYPPLRKRKFSTLQSINGGW